MHRIYLAATINYGLGSNGPEELTYYKKLEKRWMILKRSFKKSDTS